MLWGFQLKNWWVQGSYVIRMDLNASPAKDDEQSYQEYVEDVQQPSESVLTMLRVSFFLQLGADLWI